MDKYQTKSAGLYVGNRFDGLWLKGYDWSNGMDFFASFCMISELYTGFGAIGNSLFETECTDLMDWMNFDCYRAYKSALTGGMDR